MSDLMGDTPAHGARRVVPFSPASTPRGGPGATEARLAHPAQVRAHLDALFNPARVAAEMASHTARAKAAVRRLLEEARAGTTRDLPRPPWTLNYLRQVADAHQLPVEAVAELAHDLLANVDHTATPEARLHDYADWLVEHRGVVDRDALIERLDTSPHAPKVSRATLEQIADSVLAAWR